MLFKCFYVPVPVLWVIVRTMIRPIREALEERLRSCLLLLITAKTCLGWSILLIVIVIVIVTVMVPLIAKVVLLDPRVGSLASAALALPMLLSICPRSMLTSGSSQ